MDPQRKPLRRASPTAAKRDRALDIALKLAVP
jgi:hypothetical protein